MAGVWESQPVLPVSEHSFIKMERLKLEVKTLEHVGQQKSSLEVFPEDPNRKWAKTFASWATECNVVLEPGGSSAFVSMSIRRKQHLLSGAWTGLPATTPSPGADSCTVKPQPV